MLTTIKLLAVSLPIAMIVFLRNALVIIFLSGWLWRSQNEQFATQRFGLHFIRAMSGLVAMYCFFFTVSYLPLAEAAILKMTTPFFIPIIAWFWLMESIPRRVNLGICLGFIGVAVILRPGWEAFSAVALIALLGSFAAAFAKVAVRRLSTTESSVQIVFYFAMLSAIVSAFPAVWHWQLPDWQGWILAGQLLMTKAYSLSAAGNVGAFTYSSIIFATLLGWLVWGTWIDQHFVFGAALICFSGIMIISQPRTVKSG